MVWSIFRNGSECSSVAKTLKKKTTSLVLWCYRLLFIIKWTDVIRNSAVLSRMSRIKVGTPVLLQKIICRQCPVFGRVARRSAGRELRECFRSNDKQTGRGRRKIRWMDTISEMPREKGIGRKQIGMEKKNQDFEYNNTTSLSPESFQQTNRFGMNERRRRSTIAFMPKSNFLMFCLSM